MYGQPFNLQNELWFYCTAGGDVTDPPPASIGYEGARLEDCLNFALVVKDATPEFRFDESLALPDVVVILSVTVGGVATVYDSGDDIWVAVAPLVPGVYPVVVSITVNGDPEVRNKSIEIVPTAYFEFMDDCPWEAMDDSLMEIL